MVFFLGHALGGSIAASSISGILLEGGIKVEHVLRGAAFIAGGIIAGAKLYPKLIRESFNNKRDAVQALKACYD